MQPYQSPYLYRGTYPAQDQRFIGLLGWPLAAGFLGGLIGGGLVGGAIASRPFYGYPVMYPGMGYPGDPGYAPMGYPPIGYQGIRPPYYY
jgi:hypothetical protein